jgi:hypothetical protein
MGTANHNNMNFKTNPNSQFFDLDIENPLGRGTLKNSNPPCSHPDGGGEGKQVMFIRVLAYQYFVYRQSEVGNEKKMLRIA